MKKSRRSNRKRHSGAGGGGGCGGILAVHNNSWEGHCDVRRRWSEEGAELERLMVFQHKHTSWRVVATGHEQVGFTRERAGRYLKDEGPPHRTPPKRPISLQPPQVERIRPISRVSALTRQNPCNVIRARHRRGDELSSRCYGNASYAESRHAANSRGGRAREREKGRGVKKYGGG